MVVTASLKYIDKTDYIAVDISMRIGKAVSHTSLSGQVANPVEFLLFKKALRFSGPRVSI